MSLIKLFFIFLKIGAILLGGGYIILPILEHEFVNKQKLISSSDLIDYFALSQSLPGIIAANISMFIGHKLKGIIGAVTAIAGITFVPFCSIVILASVLNKITNNTYISDILWGVGIAVIALILLTVREIWQKSDKNIFFYTIFIPALLSLVFLKLTPIQTILIFCTAGILVKKFAEAKK